MSVYQYYIYNCLLSCSTESRHFSTQVISLYVYIRCLIECHTCGKKFVCDMAQCTVLTLLLIGAYAYVY